MVELRAAKICGRLKVGPRNKRGECWTILGPTLKSLVETGNTNLLERKWGKVAKSCQCLKVHSHPDQIENFQSIPGFALLVNLSELNMLGNLSSL